MSAARAAFWAECNLRLRRSEENVLVPRKWQFTRSLERVH